VRAQHYVAHLGKISTTKLSSLPRIVGRGFSRDIPIANNFGASTLFLDINLASQIPHLTNFPPAKNLSCGAPQPPRRFFRPKRLNV
jgi:hypothetical protein